MIGMSRLSSCKVVTPCFQDKRHECAVLATFREELSKIALVCAAEVLMRVDNIYKWSSDKDSELGEGRIRLKASPQAHCSRSSGLCRGKMRVIDQNRGLDRRSAHGTMPRWKTGPGGIVDTVDLLTTCPAEVNAILMGGRRVCGTSCQLFSCNTAQRRSGVPNRLSPFPVSQPEPESAVFQPQLNALQRCAPQVGNIVMISDTASGVGSI